MKVILRKSIRQCRTKKEVALFVNNAHQSRMRLERKKFAQKLALHSMEKEKWKASYIDISVNVALRDKLEILRGYVLARGYATAIPSWIMDGNYTEVGAANRKSGYIQKAEQARCFT